MFKLRVQIIVWVESDTTKLFLKSHYTFKCKYCLCSLKI